MNISGAPHLTPSSYWRIVPQGIALHFATIAGALRASSEFRSKHRHWRRVVWSRFVKEYGLNLLLFAALQVLVLTVALPSTAKAWLFWEISIVLLLPVLSVVQLGIDHWRTSSTVFYDATCRAGMTIKTMQGHTWAFNNHYALPIGHRHGVKMRDALHQIAVQQHMNLVCYAQNHEIANYYLTSHPGGVILEDGFRPLLLWKYNEEREFVWDKKQRWDIFGLDSIRDSGQLPTMP